MKKEKQKKYSVYLYGFVMIIILATVLFIFYSENNKGVLKINTIGESVTIFIDEIDKGISDIKEEGKKIKLSKGNHSIILSKKGFWPWVSEIDIAKKQLAEIYPFFVPQNTSGYIIPPEDPEYEKILSLFYTNKTHIEWEKNENTPEIVRNFESEIRASDFYKDRQDVIIIAVENGIYALETNSSTTPNFQPIYKGIEPTFIKKDNNSIYVKDGDMLMEVAY